MKSLKEHNNEATQRWLQDGSSPRPNGIACPQCGDELEDRDPSVVLTSNPPQLHVRCSSCGYVGLRVQ